MSGIRISQLGKTPAYTVEDVRAFLTAQPIGHLNTVSGAPFSIDAVEFVGPELAEQLTHGGAHGAVAPGDLLCIVRLSGPFSGDGISLRQGARLRRPPAHAVLVFDAHNGRLIMEGFHD